MARGKVATDPDALFEALKAHCDCPKRIVMETGTLCHWLARELRQGGLPVVGIDARQAHAVMKSRHDKTDAGDAELLALIAHRMGATGEAFRWPAKEKRATAWTWQEDDRVPRTRQNRPRRDDGRGDSASLAARRTTVRDRA